MKLEKLFYAKDFKLFNKDDKEVMLDSIPAKSISWKLIEPLNEGEYNEELLASMRDELKILDEKNSFIFMEAIADKNALNAEYAQVFTACMKHSARRLKDCVSIAGFSIPSELIALGKPFVEDYINELSAKHAQYVYFVKKSDFESSNEELKQYLSSNEVVLYN
ncbi:MAG: hypothetical protein K6F69_00455 [Treponema sp.]|nr:hypothetical protein [Treponema sp.]